VGEHEIQARGGSKPPVLGEDALLQPVVARRFGVEERDAHVAKCRDTRAVGGEGEGAFCKFHSL
jgi:hypothetical protein